MKDYTPKAALAMIALMVCLVLISVIPPLEVMGVELRRVSVLSSILEFEDNQTQSAQSELQLDMREFEVDFDEVSEKVTLADSLEKDIQTHFVWTIVNSQEQNNALAPATKPDDLKAQLDTPLVPIENFDTLGGGKLGGFYNKLLSGDSLVRIAFLGDSFIEGDILTSDLREVLQDNFGGSGTGFAPTASPLTGFRRSVKTLSRGWTSYNIMQRKKAPLQYREDFTISGWICKGQSSSSTLWTMTDNKRHGESCQIARLHFIAREHTRLRISVNDTLVREFSIQGAQALREILIQGDDIRSLKMELVEGNSTFTSYGAMFHGAKGVSLDNYSTRSNNGQAMFWSNATINAQLDKAIGGYDLIVLQYGLNLMAQNVFKYSNYSEQIDKMIAYCRECFPGAAILVMGVSERYVRDGESFAPMNSIASFVDYQREAARRCGAAFWDTHSSMLIQGGMAEFVRQGWAGKDYTHINWGGGRRIALALGDALMEGAKAHRDSLRVQREKEQLENIATFNPTQLKLIDATMGN